MSSFDLSLHEQQWSRLGIHDYTYDYVNDGPIGQANVHVTVHADTVASVIDATTGTAPEFSLSVPTIDGLFSFARTVLGEKGETVSLEFDSQLGYPTLVSAMNNNPGGPFIAHVSNLHQTQ